jgi:Ca2+-binding RTX toxin-like protein
VRFALDAGSDECHSASLYLNGTVVNSLFDIHPHSPFALIDPSQAYTVLGDVQSGLVIDNATRTLLPGGIGDYPEIGSGTNDTVVLDGDYATGFALGTPDFIEPLVVTGDNDFSLVADDGNIAPGATLTINATPLGDGHHIAFDGSAETDGHFLFLGSQAGDVFLGGAGDDVIYGHGGGDILSGGGGSDTFGYFAASQSTGTGYDILADFDPAADKIDLNVTVTGFDTAIQSGTLSAGSFDADLGGALAGLGAGHAVLYTPDAGDLAGKIFLIVDANGVAGYQEGEDYVFALQGTTLADLSAHTGFFV